MSKVRAPCHHCKFILNLEVPPTKQDFWSSLYLSCSECQKFNQTALVTCYSFPDGRFQTISTSYDWFIKFLLRKDFEDKAGISRRILLQETVLSSDWEQKISFLKALAETSSPYLETCPYSSVKRTFQELVDEIVKTVPHQDWAVILTSLSTNLAHFYSGILQNFKN